MHTPIFEQESQATRKILWAIPLLAIVPIGIMTCVLWDEVSEGYYAKEFIWTVLISLGSGIGFVAAAMMKFKNLYLDRTQKELYFTRPFLPLLSERKWRIGAPQKVRIHAKLYEGGEGSVILYWLSIYCSANRKRPHFRISFGLREDAQAAALKIWQETGAQIERTGDPETEEESTQVR